MTTLSTSSDLSFWQQRATRQERQPTVCVLALSPIADDPRVRRQADAFYDAGWHVVAIGLPGGRSPAPRWPILSRDDLVRPEPAVASCAAPAFDPLPPPPNFRSRLVRLYRGANRFVPVSQQHWDRLERSLKHVWSRGEYAMMFAKSAARQLASRSGPFYKVFSRELTAEVAEQRFWSMSSNILDMYACGQTIDADLWLANDWTALPIAAKLARERGGIYGYDTHEFATEEYAESRSWRLLQRPFVLAVERRSIAGAAVTSAVSSGIAERLDQLYTLPRPTLTIRNMPVYEAVPFRPTDPDHIRVLYHGLVSPNRGIEATIDSVARWRREFTLTIRGPGDEAYLAALQDQIARQRLGDRVEVVPPVPMTALVREAAAFDVGFFALPGHSHHNQFALPNKFFEYTMAGLALCMTDLSEMARLMDQHDLGVTFPEAEPGVIATAINALTVEQIDRCKRNALAAAHELCWDREAERLVSAYTAAESRAMAGG